jgi:hypothetical protein
MPPFLELAQLGEALAATKKKLKHRTLIGAYLKSLPPDEITIAARLIIGRVFPESAPRILNLSGSAVGQVIEDLTGAPMDWGAVGVAVDYKSGVALRLARILNFRPDKFVAEVETVQYLRELMAAAAEL